MAVHCFDIKRQFFFFFFEHDRGEVNFVTVCKK